MDSSRFPLGVSSAIIFVTVVTSLIGCLYWYQHRIEGRFHQSWPWKIVLRHAAMAAISIGFGISLLILSLSGNEKICAILLLCFGRALIISQVGFYWETCSLVLYRHTHLVLLAICSCFLGLTVFVVQGIARDQVRASMIKIGLISFGLESLGLSVLYMWLLWRLKKVWYKQYNLLLALITSVPGCLSAVIPFLITLARPVDWDIAIWVYIAIATLWFFRAIILGLCSLNESRRAVNNDEAPFGQSISLDDTEVWGWESAS